SPPPAMALAFTRKGPPPEQMAFMAPSAQTCTGDLLHEPWIPQPSGPGLRPSPRRPPSFLPHAMTGPPPPRRARLCSRPAETALTAPDRLLTATGFLPQA